MKALSIFEWLTIILILMGAVFEATNSFGSKDTQRSQGLRIRKLENKWTEVAVNLKAIAEHDGLKYHEVKDED